MIVNLIYLELLKHITLNYTIDHQYFRLYSSVFSVPLMGYNPPIRVRESGLTCLIKILTSGLKTGSRLLSTICHIPPCSETC